MEAIHSSTINDKDQWRTQTYQHRLQHDGFALLGAEVYINERLVRDFTAVTRVVWRTWLYHLLLFISCPFWCALMVVSTTTESEVLLPPLRCHKEPLIAFLHALVAHETLDLIQ